MFKEKAGFANGWHEYTISDTYQVNQSRMLIVIQILWISYIQWNTGFIDDVIKPVVMDLNNGSGNLSERYLCRWTKETVEANINGEDEIDGR